MSGLASHVAGLSRMYLFGGEFGVPPSFVPKRLVAKNRMEIWLSRIMQRAIPGWDVEASRNVLSKLILRSRRFEKG